jgi:hypothetical protein
VTWQQDTKLRDLDDGTVIEAECMRCLHVWLQSPLELMLKVDHRDVRMDVVAKNLACRRSGCRHVGVRIALIKNQDTSGFVGGMP